MRIIIASSAVSSIYFMDRHWRRAGYTGGCLQFSRAHHDITGLNSVQLTSCCAREYAILQTAVIVRKHLMRKGKFHKLEAKVRLGLTHYLTRRTIPRRAVRIACIIHRVFVHFLASCLDVLLLLLLLLLCRCGFTLRNIQPS